MSKIKFIITASGATLLIITSITIGLKQFTYQKLASGNTEPKVSLNFLNSISPKTISGDYMNTNFINDNQKLIIKSLSNDNENSTFDDILSSDDITSQTQNINGAEITIASEEPSGEVVAVEVKDNETRESNTIINSGTSLLLSKTVYNETTEQYENKSCEVPLNIADNSVQPLAKTYGSWQYTNIAIGTSALAFTLDWVGPQAAVSKLAVIFKISQKVAQGFVAGLALNTAGFGNRVANYLDKNKNGWIGLYQRWAKDTSFKNGLVTQNITYTEWKTE